MGWPGPMTHRQFAVWLAWLGEEWNHPSRTDHYLMQLDVTVKRLLAKHPGRIKFEQSQLKFGPVARRGPQTKEQATAISKAAWLGRMTMPVTVVDQHGNEVKG